MIDHVKFVNDSNSVEIIANRSNFKTNIDSALSYNTLGGSDLHFIANVDTEKLTFNSYISNLDILSILDSSEIENLYFDGIFNLADLVNINVGALAIGNKTTLDIYPILNLNLIPVNNKDIQVKVNIGATLYLGVLPDLNFETLINQNSSNLVTNYAANASLQVNSETLKLSIGANYLVTEDPAKFTTNMIHKSTTRDVADIFTAVETNTLTAIAKISYTNDFIDLCTIYSLPLDASSFAIGDDLIDINLALNFSKFSLGGFYLHNDFINHLKAISDIKAFLINTNTEYGAYISYIIKDLTMKGALALPSSNLAPLALTLSMAYKLDFTL